MNRLLGIAMGIASVAVGLGAESIRAQATAQPETITFTAKLLPANEVPPVTNAEAKGSGDVTVTLKVSRDSAKAITSATADFKASLSGFPPGTAVTMAHIHRGATGANGDVVVNTGVAAGEVVLGTGSGSFSKAGVIVTPAIAEEILKNSAGFYFNVHSALNKSGVARGQLERK